MPVKKSDKQIPATILEREPEINPQRLGLYRVKTDARACKQLEPVSRGTLRASAKTRV